MKIIEEVYKEKQWIVTVSERRGERKERKKRKTKYEKVILKSC
jgi:hypothetical protein